MRHVRAYWSAGGWQLVNAYDPKQTYRCEHDVCSVLLDHSPIRRGIGRAHGLTLEKHGLASVEQRGVDDVRMAHDPPNIACAEIAFTRAYLRWWCFFVYCILLSKLLLLLCFPAVVLVAMAATVAAAAVAAAVVLAAVAAVATVAMVTVLVSGAVGMWDGTKGPKVPPSWPPSTTSE